IEVTAGFHPDLTGMENIFLHGTILGMSKREIQSKLDQIIAFSGIEEFIDTPVKRYSSGMYARLGFSVAAHVDPEVLVVDEVLSVGDFVFQQRCIDRIRSIVKGGTTVLFVSHNLKSVSEICQRAMLLEQGKVVTIDSADKVMRRYLSGGPAANIPTEKKSVYVNKVTLRNRFGEQSTFESGETAWVDVEVTAREAVQKLAVVIWFADDSERIIFHTSTERLGSPAFSLQPGGTYRCTFELSLNIAHGTFHLVTEIYRYDIQKSYDRFEPSPTMFIGTTLAVGGSVNCFPRLLASETIAPSTQSCEV
ncbi:MAG: Wzt carbohydrate-binding domain-containing protein, partial [Candidatus Acidiferrum sp.]